MKKEDGKRSDCYKGIDHTRQIKRRKIKYINIPKEEYYVDEPEPDNGQEYKNSIHQFETCRDAYGYFAQSPKKQRRRDN